MVHRIVSKAERRVEREQLADLRWVQGKTNLLFGLAEAALANPQGTISEVLLPIVDPEDLVDLVREHHTDGPALRSMANGYARSSYARHYRRSLLAVQERLSFDSSNTAHRPVCDAIELICRYSGRPGGFFDRDEQVPIEGIVSPAWRRLVLIKDGTGVERVNRIGYEICVLGVLRARLRCKEIWVEHSHRWRDPDQDLPADFDTQRPLYYQAIIKPADPDEFIDKIRHRVAGGLDRLNQFVTDGGDGMVHMSERRTGWIQLQPLEAQPEPANLGRLKDELNQRWPSTSLLDILKEPELRLGICDQFETTATREALPTEVLRRRLLELFAVGTNAGIRRIASSEPGTDTESDLHYIRRRYLTPANLRRAITTVVNATHAARHEHHWGHLTTTASDRRR
ncbi:MAG: transposase [bacterium]|nr:transposase [bacterium]